MFSGGLSNVTRQHAGDRRVHRTCFVTAASFTCRSLLLAREPSDARSSDANSSRLRYHLAPACAPPSMRMFSPFTIGADSR